MKMSSTQPTKATLTVPLITRLYLTILEPLMCLNGVYLTLFHPSEYHSKITRFGLASFSPENQFLYTQLAAAWLVFGFNEAIVLWLVDDLRVWKLLCIGMLLSDAVYFVSSVEAVGGWERFSAIGEWDAFDWSVFIMAVIATLMRLVVLGVNGNKAKRA
ncbi:hypothetical protein QBC35DRAFT_185410 [Podospora australis]|uniref:DUF7704 domain-containing protein n=1 Tax=Podospora australis TaxID=1536484 RepID=A0AAN6WW67_9PEZI|nr:hypothetical protein QBC35DRAFT_185410 [Podospora australis]